MLRHYAEQKEEFEKMMQGQREEFAARSEETITLMKEIKNLAEVKSVMSQVLEATKNQTAAIERLANSLKNQPNGSYTQTAVEPTSFNPKIELPRSIVYMVAVITISAVASLGIYIYTTFVEKPKVTTITDKPISKQASTVVGTDSTSL